MKFFVVLFEPGSILFPRLIYSLLTMPRKSSLRQVDVWCGLCCSDRLYSRSDVRWGSQEWYASEDTRTETSNIIFLGLRRERYRKTQEMVSRCSLLFTILVLFSLRVRSHRHRDHVRIMPRAICASWGPRTSWCWGRHRWLSVPRSSSVRNNRRILLQDSRDTWWLSGQLCNRYPHLWVRPDLNDSVIQSYHPANRSLILTE